jgi:hypothetical protein
MPDFEYEDVPCTRIPLSPQRATSLAEIIQGRPILCIWGIPFCGPPYLFVSRCKQVDGWPCYRHELTEEWIDARMGGGWVYMGVKMDTWLKNGWGRRI